jgi:glycosyltransferase involved in cell wall biosynthesis
MCKKHFFFVDYLDYKSGWGTFTLNYLKKLEPETVVVFCYKSNPDKIYKQIEILPDVNSLMSNPLKILLNIIKIRKEIKIAKKNYKIFSHFTVEPYLIYLPFINFFNKNFYYAVGSYSLQLFYSKKTKFIFIYSLRLINYIIFLSGYTKLKLSKIKKILPKNSIVINPVIESKVIDNFNFKKFEKFSLLSVGMLKSRKGYFHLIEVMNLLINQKKQNIILNIIGKKEESSFEELRLLIEKYDLQNFINIKTNVNDVQLEEFYKKSHMFILLSNDVKHHFEGFGIVYLEALSYNLPVIISNQTGAMDLKEISNELYFVNPNSYIDISNMIIKHINIKKNSHDLRYVKILSDHNLKNSNKIQKFYKNKLI